VVLRQGELFRWARCKKPLPLLRMWQLGMPLPEEHLHILEPALYWEDFKVRAQPRGGG
jgi:hypothetical protein